MRSGHWYLRTTFVCSVVCFALVAVAIGSGPGPSRAAEQYGLGPANPPVLFQGGEQWTTVKAPPTFAMPLRLNAFHRETIPIRAAMATVASRRGVAVRAIHVSLRRTHYNGTYLRSDFDRVEQSPVASLYCYELVPAEGSGDDPYTWAMWSRSSPWAPKSFWLFDLGEKGTYLLFAHLGVSVPNLPSLSLVDVTYARDRISAFSEDFAGWPEQSAPIRTWQSTREDLVSFGLLPASAVHAANISRLLEEENRRRGGDPNVPLIIFDPRSVALDKNGNPVVNFRLSRSGPVGTLAMKEGRWTLIQVHPPTPEQVAEPLVAN